MQKREAAQRQQYVLPPAAEIMNCRWQVKQMSQSMAHSMKRFQGICESLEEKAGVSASANVLPPPPPARWGDVKLLQVEKLEGERQSKVEWFVVLGYSLPPSGIFTCLKSRHFRLYAHSASLSVSLSVSHAYISI